MEDTVGSEVLAFERVGAGVVGGNMEYGGGVLFEEGGLLVVRFEEVVDLLL